MAGTQPTAQKYYVVCVILSKKWQTLFSKKNTISKLDQ